MTEKNIHVILSFEDIIIFRNEENMYDKALIEYLIEFHSKRDYFECHEILEERWVQDEIRSVYWTTLIQIAVAMYHYRRKNLEGAEKLFTMALGKINKNIKDYTDIGFNAEQLKKQIENALANVKDQKPYESKNLAMTNDLISACEQECKKHNIKTFLNISNMNDERILNRHLPPWRYMEE